MISDDLIYLSSALILIVAVLALLIFSTYQFIDPFSYQIGKNISKLLVALLLVLMLVKIGARFHARNFLK